MADLSAYVDFSVRLDKSGNTPAIVLTDTSAYPAGVAATVTGVFAATQPDSISLTGNFITPDVAYVSGALTACSKELRTATDNNFQNGNYTFTYTVKATGYVDTVKTKNFTLTYTPVTTAISDLTNPFDPAVQVIDATKYPVAGFNNPTVTRAWTGYIKNVGSTIQTLSSTAALFDLAYGGNYYDAHYDLAFTALATYVNTTNTWVSLKDSFATTYQIDAYTPASLNSLCNSLQAMKEQIEAGTYCGGCGCGCEGTDYEPYQTAMSLFDGFVDNGQNGLSPYELFPTYEQIIKKVNCSGILNLTHTNAVIPDYDWGTVVPPFIQHRPIQFIVGGGQQYAPVGGATDYINATLASYTGYLVYSSADANYLIAGVDFSYNTSGGWSWLGGRTFNTGDKYTLTFS